MSEIDNLSLLSQENMYKLLVETIILMECLYVYSIQKNCVSNELNEEHEYALDFVSNLKLPKLKLFLIEHLVAATPREDPCWMKFTNVCDKLGVESSLFDGQDILQPSFVYTIHI